VYGTAQLGLLAFGVFAALTLLGDHPAIQPSPQLGAWAPWVGILLCAIGYVLFSVAPRRAFFWILIALGVAYGSQLIASRMVGAELSGFVGATVVIIVVAVLRRMPGSPPSAVMLTCAYWLLVPGALGFMGLSSAVEHAAGGSALLMQFVTSLVAIAIGMVVGGGVINDASAAARAWHVSTRRSA
jgi:uncharacterized membrane protein YjjB (DUF3815 family)